MALEIFRLFGSIFVDNEKANKSISDTGSRGEKLAKGLSSAFGTLGKVAVAGVGAAAAGIAGVTKLAVDSYAQYEQLTGGVETLFAESADTVIGYAKQAYITAGMNANEYMEAVTASSAAMIASLGGDTAAAAEKANMSISDMSDNANKMGSDLESLKNAYSGFAKGQFTMLDNLKLGYGGTQSEMQRLLDDAEKISGIKYDISSYADIVDAIHVVQTEMGITGTTAREAASTIEGSGNMMKAAWQNVLIGLSDTNQDLPALLDEAVNATMTFGDNIIPRVQVIMGQIGAAAQYIAPAILEQIPAVAGAVLPGLAESALNLVFSLGGMIVSNAPSVLSEFLPEMGAELISLLGMLWQMVLDAGPQELRDFADQYLNPLFDAINEKFQTFGDLISGVTEFVTEHKTALENVAVAVGVFVAALSALTSIPAMISGITATITAGIGVVSAGLAPLIALFTGSGGILGGLTAIVSALGGPVTLAIAAVIAAGVLLYKNWDTVKAKALEFGAGVLNTFRSVGDGVKNAWESAMNYLTEKIDNAKNKVKGAIDAIKGFFNFKFQWPNLPLPHFSISPDGWKIGDLLKGEIPSLAVKWFAQAMNEPMLLNGATIFGYGGGSLLGGGEVPGGEIISGRDAMARTVSGAVDSSMAPRFDRMLELMEAYMPLISKMGVVLDSGALVGELTPHIDSALGGRYDRYARGV